jgi:hypothetical protein
MSTLRFIETNPESLGHAAPYVSEALHELNLRLVITPVTTKLIQQRPVHISALFFGDGGSLERMVSIFLDVEESVLPRPKVHNKLVQSIL